MKALHVTSGLAPVDGGPAFALAGLAPALVAAGVQTTVASTFRSPGDDQLCQLITDGGARLELIGPARGPLGRHPELYPRLDQLVRDADVVHIHALWEEIQHAAAALARRHAKPYIIRPCGMLDPWSLSQSRWKKKLVLAWRVRKDLNHAAALHFTTDAERDLTAPLRLRAPAIVEPNGINTAGLTAPPRPEASLRHRHPHLPGGPIALFLSRLHHKKGTDLLIDAFATVTASWDADRHGPPPALVVAGPDEGGYLAQLEAQTQRLGLSGSVVFTGMLTGPDKVDALQSADLFCLPSHQENFGIAVVEALAAGTPVLISDQVNIHEAITAAGVGQAVPLDPPAIADALRDWLTDPARRQAAANQASAWACQAYDWQAIAQRWSDRYSSIMGFQ